MDGRVNVTLAVMVIIFTLISIVVLFTAVGEIMYSYNNQSAYITYANSGYYVTIMIINFINMIFQFIVLKEWMDVLNRNILNTQSMISTIKTEDLSVKSEIETASLELKNAMVKGWPFWAYMISYIIGILFVFEMGVMALFEILAFIFLLIYLYHIFSSYSAIYKTKSRLYSYLRNMKGLPNVQDVPQITQRNIFLVVIFTIITAGVYWLYLIVKLSLEINEYVKNDEITRTKLA
ncbi:hypothetical protein [Athalassotoga saccharophila]|uniref:hypothetical protein n=1 Tax=Athalassotoga saccharophila TaxID=1441386 RepID=UPI001379AE73|nr:hypothetical protein [Athalassotoga saccharophila]BBJ27721.1 hypothetical protein ATHSA_0610 [Athalassotoga saccharophila]